VTKLATSNATKESDSFLYDSSGFSKSDLSSFLKSNLLIDLSDMKNGKVIVHSKKNDDNLAFLYTNKRVHDRATSALSDSEPPIDRAQQLQHQLTLQPPPQQAPPQSQLLILPKLYDAESVSVSTDSSNGLTRGDNLNGSWRDRFYQFYNYLEVNNSDSYRKSYKVTFDRVDQSPTLPNLNLAKPRRSNRKF
jgi:hypothetical protein